MLAGAISILAAIHAFGIWWGLPGTPNSWAPDEFSPLLIHDAVGQRFSNGWQVLYPPAHVYVLALILAPVEVLDAVGAVEFGSRPTYLISYYLIRFVSVVMAAGIGLVVFQIGRELWDARSGIFSTLGIGLCVPFVFYAKLANVEVPYLLWLALSFLYYVRILARHRQRDYVLFALTAALAIGTKDQASMLYVFMPLTIAASRMRMARQRGEPISWGSALVNRNTLTVAAVGAVALLLIHNVLFNWTGAVDRLRTMTGPITTSLQEFPNTPAGHAAMLSLAVRHLQFSMGWPFFLAAVAGLVIAARRPGEHARALALLPPILSYWTFLIVPLMYHYDRYMLPVVLILSLFGGLAMARFMGPGAFRSVRRIVVMAAIAFTVTRGASVDALLASDGRYAAERWIQANAPAGSRIMGVGYDVYLPHMYGMELLVAPRPSLEQLAEMGPDMVVTTSIFDEERFHGDDRALSFLRDLRSGKTPYQLVFTARGRPAFNLLDFAGVRTNLDKINPVVHVYRRVESVGTRTPG